MHQQPLLLLTLAVLLLATPSEIGAQRLAFSKDGRLLREAQAVFPERGQHLGHVRALTYVASTGAVQQVLDLAEGTELVSSTSDGRTAVILLSDKEGKGPAHALLVDMDTGRSQSIPSEWFDPDDERPYAQISGDGRLVSAFTLSGTEAEPLVVTVYNWHTEKPVMKESTNFPAGGLIWGGVTEDGQIQFLTTRDCSWEIRSPNGNWAVDFPNGGLCDTPNDVVIRKGASAKIVGKLDLMLSDQKRTWAWTGAFCGTSGRFVAATYDTFEIFEIPSGRKIGELPPTTWQDTDTNDPVVIVACSPDGKRVAIRSGMRLTFHNLK